MVKNGHGPPPKELWAYAYDVALPSDDGRFHGIQRVLDREHSEARAGARTWAGRMVVEPQVTRILVVSDSPARDRNVNRSLEAELKVLKARFVVTEPLLVVDGESGHGKDGRSHKT